MSDQTFTFKQDEGQVEEEEEDGYIEDPYIKREDWLVEEVNSAEENSSFRTWWQN